MTREPNAEDEPTVGTARPIGYQYKGVYVGPRQELRGKTAIICNCTASTVACQFDDTATGLGFGWHEFPTGDVQLLSDHDA